MRRKECYGTETLPPVTPSEHRDYHTAGLLRPPCCVRQFPNLPLNQSLLHLMGAIKQGIESQDSQLQKLLDGGKPTWQQSAVMFAEDLLAFQGPLDPDTQAFREQCLAAGAAAIGLKARTLREVLPILEKDPRL